MGAIYGALGPADPAEICAVGARLAHRGPAAAQWFPSRYVLLGVRGTHQVVRGLEGGPLALDGVIDNRTELAGRLGLTAGPSLGPDDDARLVLALLENEGPEGLQHAAGQFALAWWDRAGARLLLARDRIGYAPLYFTIDPAGRLLFASEYKALLAVATVPVRPNRDAIQVIQATKWLKPGVTCLVDIYPVAPGSWLAAEPERMHTARFWDLPARAQHRDEARHVATLRSAFLETMRQQIAPYDRVGVSLSGGLDSAVMAAGVRHVAGEREVHTFSAGYGPDDRELVNAELVARKLGTRHHPLILDPEDLPHLLPWMVWHLEEPIGREDIAYLYVTAREAGRFVDLILTGFGYDGLFAGLPRHRVASLAMSLPALSGPLTEFYDYVYRSVEPRSLLGRALRAAYFRGRDYPVPTVLGAAPLAPLPAIRPTGEQPLTEFLLRGFRVLPYQSPVERLYAAAGLRMNAHHTDPAFLATALSIPDRLKIRGRTQKYVLRKACEGLLPRSMLGVGKSFNRLRHDQQMSEVLDRMADDLLAPAVLRERGLFDPAHVARVRRRPPGRPYTQERAYRLWSMLLCEWWCRMYLDHRGAPPQVALPPVRRL